MELNFPDLSVQVRATPTEKWRTNITATFIGLLLPLALVVMSASARDWPGLINNRLHGHRNRHKSRMLEQNRGGVDRVAQLALISRRNRTEQPNHEPVKIVVQFPPSSAVSLFTTRCIVKECLVTSPPPTDRVLYRWVRWCG